MSREKPSILDRSLRPFADVRPGEGATVVLLALNVFLILTAYYIVKTVREALILGNGSAELKSYTAAAQVLVLVFAVRLYGRLADRVPRRRLINIVTAVFVACLVGFFAVARAGVPIGVVFFVWVGIFNLMIVAQFWSFANDVYSEDEGERLFPIVAFGASLGAVLGAWVSGILIEPLGIYGLMIVGALLLVVEVALTNAIDARERARTEGHLPEAMSTASMTATGSFQLRRDDLMKMLEEYDRRQEETRDAEARGEDIEPGDGGAETSAAPWAAKRGPKTARDRDLERAVSETLSGAPRREIGAFALVFRSRYLLMIGLLLMFLNWVNTTGEYILGTVVRSAAEHAVASGAAGGLTVPEFVGGFYSDFFAVVNVVGLLVQLFLVSRIIKYFGVRVGILVLPVLALGAYGLIAFYPVLSAVRWMKTAENATDYSLNNTVRNMLFLPLTREEKYKAKQAIDSFFVRAGDVLSAALVFIGTSILAIGTAGFALVNAALISVWLVLAVSIGLEYRRRTAGV